MSSMHIDDETKNNLFLLKNDIERIEKRIISYTWLISQLVETYGPDFLENYKKKAKTKSKENSTQVNSKNKGAASIT